MPSELLMEIDSLKRAELVRRLNRFVLEVKINDRVVKAHLRDSGRLTELMNRGNVVLVREKIRKKTQYEVFAIYDGSTPVIVNSSIHSAIGARILEMEGYKILKKEVKVGNSRIDLLAEKDGEEILVEIKGCTLVKNKTALFPDAPTERGVRHVKKITETHGLLLFLVMRGDAEKMMPNIRTHPEFASALSNALKKGVDVKVALLNPVIWENSLFVEIKGFIPVFLPDL